MEVFKARFAERAKAEAIEMKGTKAKAKAMEKLVSETSVVKGDKALAMKVGR